MEILFITTQVEPFSGNGPIAPVCGALPKALRGLGHSVTVLSPLYGPIDPSRHALGRRLSTLDVEVAGKTYACVQYTGRTAGGIEMVFLGHDELFQPTDALAKGDEDTVALRASVFARAASALIQASERRIDVVHGHGWVGAMALAVAREAGALDGRGSVLTIHDVAKQGTFEPSRGAVLGLGSVAEHEGEICVLKAGLLAADVVTTVSPTYAAHIRTPEGGYGLHEVLAGLGDRLVGISNGLDAAVWNPLTDPELPARFDPVDRRGKAKCKTALQRELSLPIRSDVPLVGVIGTTDPRDGLDVLASISPDILRNDVQLVVQLDGSGELVSDFEELWDKWPDRIQIRTGHDAAFSHRLYGAADLFVVPAREAASSTPQLCAQRYGAVPIVHRTGGLSDSVIDCEASLRTGTGFAFDTLSGDELLAHVRRGLAAHALGEAFEELQARCMRLDLSWERSGRLYDRVYRRAAGVEPTDEVAA